MDWGEIRVCEVGITLMGLEVQRGSGRVLKLAIIDR